MDEIKEHIKDYLDAKLDIYKLKFVKRTSPILGKFMGSIVSIMLILFIVFLLNIALALFLGQTLESYVNGFLITAGINILLLLIILLGFNKKIKEWISDSILRSYIKSHLNDD